MLIKANRLKLSVELQCGIYNNLVIPVLLYACEIWGFSDLSSVELFHRKCLKTILRVNKFTAHAIIYGETGSHKIELNINKRIINFWNHLKNDQGKISNMIFKFSHTLFNQINGLKSKWLLKVNQILISAGTPYLWNIGYIASPALKSLIDHRIKDYLLHEWHTMLDNNRLCLNYRLIKETFEIEHYLTISDEKIRIPLAKFRSGSHFLPISDQRYRDMDPRNYCPLCQTNEVGDEYHYIMSCPAFNHQRSKYIDPYFTNRPNILKYKNSFRSPRHQNFVS